MTPSRPGALELLEPALRRGQVGGRRRDVDRRARARERVDQGGAPLAERTPGVVVVAEGEQVERDEGRRRLLGEHPHPRIGRVDALLQRLEVQAVVGGDDDLAVDHAALRQLGAGPRRPAPGNSGSSAARCGCPARPRRRRGSRWTGNHPIWARRTRPGGIVLTDLASIGETGGMTGKSIGLIVASGMLESDMAAAAEELDVDGIAVRVTNPDKVYFPELGSNGTKRPARSSTTWRWRAARCWPRCGTGRRICSASPTASTARRSTRSGCRSTIPTIWRPAG